MKMKALRLLFIMSLTSLISACASASGQVFSNGPQLTHGQTGIYVYRGDNKFENRGSNFNIYVDNQKIGLLRNAGYLYAAVTPGSHTLKVARVPINDNGTTLSMSINPGQVIYYRVETNWDSTLWLSGAYIPSGHVVFKQVSPDIALEQLQSLRYSN